MCIRKWEKTSELKKCDYMLVPRLRAPSALFVGKMNLKIIKISARKESAFAESKIRSLKNFIFKYLQDKWTHSYINQLQSFIQTINSRVNSVTKLAPNKVTKKDVRKQVGRSKTRRMRKLKTKGEKRKQGIRTKKPLMSSRSNLYSKVQNDYLFTARRGNTQQTWFVWKTVSAQCFWQCFFSKSRTMIYPGRSKALVWSFGWQENFHRYTKLLLEIKFRISRKKWSLPSLSGILLRGPAG